MDKTFEDQFRKQFNVSDQEMDRLRKLEIPTDVLNFVKNPPSNCTKCHKNHKGKGQIALQDVPEGIAFDILCENCVRKALEKIGPTASTGKPTDKGILYTCPHCKLQSYDVKFFSKHNCVNITMTNDFAKSLTGDKNESNS